MFAYGEIYKNIEAGKYKNNILIFAEDLYKAYGIEENNKKEMCYNLAWEIGHANGLHDVLNYFDDLVELIK